MYPFFLVIAFDCVLFAPPTLPVPYTVSPFLFSLMDTSY